MVHSLVYRLSTQMTVLKGRIQGSLAESRYCTGSAVNLKGIWPRRAPAVHAGGAWGPFIYLFVSLFVSVFIYF